MCGIAGIWNVPIEQAAVAVGSMLDAMEHRGPDGRGMLEFRDGAAGMVRLALVDLSPRGQQPLWSQDERVAILFNGEVYNFREERARLESRGHRFRTTTDTEVILHLYLERGLEFVERLRGMYGIAIFDWRQTAVGGTPTLVMARGPLGVKPLYIAHPHGDPQKVVFSSEIRGILASGLVPPDVDRAALADYLAHGFVLQPRTMISGVRMLEPGGLECYVPGQAVRRIRFWQMPPDEQRAESLDEAAARLRTVLEESIALHAMADAPVGAFLSGGVDSTGVVGLMSKHGSNLHTYTLRFPDLPGQDEAQLADEAAHRFGCKNTIADVTCNEVAELLPRFAADLDQPSTDGLNTWLVSRAAARDVKAVLSGVGGDEWFAGYPVTRRMSRNTTTFYGRAQAIAGHLAARLGQIVPAGRLRQSIDNFSTRRDPVTTWLHGHTVFSYGSARRLAGLLPNAASQEEQFAAILTDITPDWRSESAVGLSCLLDTRVYMIDQLLRDSDATSMAHSLELRVPLVDLEVAKFARTCADPYKLNPDGGSTAQYGNSGAKRVLIHALADILPSSIVQRPKKGFALPVVQWMQGTLAPIIADTCCPEAVANRGLIEPRAAAKLWADVQSGSTDVLYPRLWSLMILELWCRATLDRPWRAAPAAANTASRNFG